ncbi:AGAP008146-PA-like protein [Anopheles sinensis]|uniref:AGAP008146-PA-like protein n=1 Tax=Anopheles sinensis TaxID=74873 RepID=A0A084W865_ANOSI|nr:AGAP008146-PA-like protein [Anopheles sinensis]
MMMAGGKVPFDFDSLERAQAIGRENTGQSQRPTDLEDVLKLGGRSCLVVVLVLAVLNGRTVVAGDFGLPYTVPGFDANFRSGIGAGVVGLVKANASLTKYELSADRSGATRVLHEVANNVTAPLNQLLGHVAASFGANGTESLKALATELESLAEPTKASLEVALASARTLEGKVRPGLVETLVANVTTISTEVGTLTQDWSTFGDALLKAGAPDSGIGASNVATLFTPELVESVISPVRLINAALGDIANAFNSVGKERTATIGYETSTNASIQNARQDLENQLSVVNRTFADAARQMEQQSNATVRQIRDGHNAILSRLSNDQSNVDRVRTYLAEVEAQGDRHNRRTGDLYRDLSANHTRTVQSTAESIASRLVAATAALTDSASLSDSGYVERCLQRHVPELRQAPYAVTRLSTCYQVDGRTLGYLTSAHNSFLEQLRLGAVYPAVQAQSVCGQGSSNCTSMYLQALTSVSGQSQVRLDAFDAFLAEEMSTLSERYNLCARAIAADIQGLVEQTVQKFSNCLLSGR